MLIVTFWLISSKILLKTEILLSFPNRETLINFQVFLPIQKVSPIPQYLVKNAVLNRVFITSLLYKSHKETNSINFTSIRRIKGFLSDPLEKTFSVKVVFPKPISLSSLCCCSVLLLAQQSHKKLGLTSSSQLLSRWE